MLANLAPLDQGSAPGWSGQVAVVGALPGGVQLSYPLMATWTGAFYLSDAVPVKLHVQGADNPGLWVQGGPALPDTPLDLQPGWVHFSVSARLDKPGPIKLLLQEGSAPAAEIDNADLWPTPPDQGLAVTVNGPSSGPAHRIDPFLGAWLPQPTRRNDPMLDPEAQPLFAAGPGSTQIRWEGELNTADGLYTMEIRSDASNPAYHRRHISNPDVRHLAKHPGRLRADRSQGGLAPGANRLPGWGREQRHGMVLDETRRGERGCTALGLAHRIPNKQYDDGKLAGLACAGALPIVVES